MHARQTAPPTQVCFLPNDTFEVAGAHPWHEVRAQCMYRAMRHRPPLPHRYGITPAHLKTWSHRPSATSQSDISPSLQKGEITWVIITKQTVCLGRDHLEDPQKGGWCVMPHYRHATA